MSERDNSRMLSLFISDTDFGGAAIACHRVYAELNRVTDNHCGWVAASATQQIGAMSAGARPSFSTLLEYELKRRLIKDERKLMLANLAFNAANVAGFVKRFNPEVIYLHNIHANMSFDLLDRFPGDIPLLLYLHDMWYLTGYCCFSIGCNKYESGCKGVCPQWGKWGLPTRAADAEWTRREKFYLRNAHRIKMIVPSRWMVKCAEDRFKGLVEVEHIPNPVDTSMFRPVGSKQDVRRLLGFDADKPLVLLGAISVTDERKGIRYLGAAMDGVRKRFGSSFSVAAFGAEAKEGIIPDVIGLGSIRDNRLLNLYYNAATCFVLPSLSESFGLVYAEAMAAGTPCVAFDTTACGELVREGETGYLAELANVNSLVDALERALRAGDDSPLSEKCRELIVEECDVQKVGEQHLDLIRRVLEKSK